MPFWTNKEERLLREMREQGKHVEEIARNIPRHTTSAIACRVQSRGARH